MNSNAIWSAVHTIADATTTRTDWSEADSLIMALAHVEMAGDDCRGYCPFCSWSDEDYDAPPKHERYCPVLRAQKYMEHRQ